MKHALISIVALVAAVVSVGGGIVDTVGFVRVSGLSSNALPAKGLIQLLTFQRGSSDSTIYDQSGNGNNCAITGRVAAAGSASTAVDAAWKGSIGFVGGLGTTWYATCPASILAGLSNMSLVLMMRDNSTLTNSTQYEPVWSYGSSTSNYMTFMLRPGSTGTPSTTANKPFFVGTTGGTGAWQWAQDTAVAPIGWTRYEIVWTGASKIDYYRNGTLINTRTSVTISPSDITGTHYYLGKNEYGDHFVEADYGLVAVYNRALSSQEISRLDAHLAGVQTRRNEFDVPLAWQISTTAIVVKGGGGTWDTNAIEPEPHIVSGTLYVYYAGWSLGGYTNPTVSLGCIGYATGADPTDPRTLTKYASNPVLCANGLGNGWPEQSVSDPMLYQHTDGTWVMYFFGSSVVGFEASPNQLGCATAPAVTGPWTMCASGPMISLGTGQTDLWRFNVIRDGSTLYGYVNATSSQCATPGGECVYLYTTSVTTPTTGWVKYGIVLNVVPATFESTRVGDLSISPTMSTVNPARRWTMAYYADGGVFYSINLAYSVDLYTWVRNAYNPTVFYTGLRPRHYQSATGAERWLMADDQERILIGR